MKTIRKINFSYWAAASINTMSMLAGIGYAWSSPCIPKLRQESGDMNPLEHPASMTQVAWITSLHCLGTMCGPLCTGVIAAKYGKKKTLLIFAIPQLLSNLIMIVAYKVEMFYVARFLMGMGSGCVFSIIPIYVAELSEPSHRGRTSVFLSLMITLTQDLVFVIGPFVTIRTLAILSLIPSVLFFTTFTLFVPESPYYYVKKKQYLEAETSLLKARRDNDIQDEFNSIIKAVNDEKQNFALKEMIKSKAAVKSTLLCVGLMFFQQFNGSNAVAAYQQSIFDASNSSIPGDKSVMIVAGVQLLAIFFVSKLIDRWGRKKLLIFSYCGQLLSMASLAVYFRLLNNKYDVNKIFWIPLCAVLLYMLSFKIGAGPVSWTVVGEVLPINYKFVLSPLVTFSMTFMSFLVTLIFPKLWQAMGLETLFWIFSVDVALAIPFVKFLLPETKEKTLIEIQKMFEKNNDL